MAVVSIYELGEIKLIDNNRKKLLKPRPGVLSSFTNRVGAIVLGIFFMALGAFSAWVVFTQQPTTFQTVVLLLGICCLPIGFWMITKARSAYGQASRSHVFFAWDRTQVVMGETRPIGQAEIRDLLKSPVPERIAKLEGLSDQAARIPIDEIKSVEVHLALPKLTVDKLKIMGAAAEIKVDVSAILPSLDASMVNGAMAFNSISQFYTEATGKTLEASVGKA